MKTTVLIIEDSPSMARTYDGFLRRAGMETIVVETCAAGIDEISREEPHAVLLDLHLPDGSGLKLLRWLQKEGRKVPVIAITANGSMGTAVEAMREGARDFLVKPFSGPKMIAALEQMWMRTEEETDDTPVPAPAAKPQPQENQAIASQMIGESLPMKAVYKIIEAAAPSDASVFITGESGTGKELAAEAIHRNSGRSRGPLVILNCAAIAPNMLESEVFGHVKGAFTGAVSDREGAAERAHGGTLFLDELGEMEIGLQSKLLRLLQEGTYMRVGESKERRADIRFVAATNRDPRKAIVEGKLREDLYFRLNVIPITMPPLRERGMDTVLIASSFLERFAKEHGKTQTTFDEGARAALASHGWPGNVRELMNVVRRAVILGTGQGDEVTAEDLALAMQLDGEGQAPVVSFSEGAWDAVVEPLHVTERRAIERALAVTEGNIQEAARLLEINPSTIYRKKTSWAV
ncbi:sigma-54-dependent Fis family transcriptional regulator [Parvularcula sp. ZS-1/3]|uniref:Sigma-54-dependent Fis family transcriptional regulator n=1 Tax=Parvularcula mediterranea TaxID=2732508 RepID=A0A7Y3RNH5_9PROT|nr:sigma-54 dependent transcriptional regulator [Parvularcula mediterranea]NNU16512.1 sigma-54-dependent Fis family transcriptional regulator [Parvularcula mediterranea]